MNSVRDLLTKIKERPGMYIGKPCVIRLHIFLEGWFHGGKEPVSDANLLNEFQSWVADRYKITTSHSWADIIEFFAGGGEDAFDLFYELLEEFESSRGSEAFGCGPTSG